MQLDLEVYAFSICNCITFLETDCLLSAYIKAEGALSESAIPALTKALEVIFYFSQLLQCECELDVNITLVTCIFVCFLMLLFRSWFLNEHSSNNCYDLCPCFKITPLKQN